MQVIGSKKVILAASLIFPAGSRPGRQAVRDLAARDRQFAISLEPGETPDPPEEGALNWVELVANGLTFDLAGLNPGPGAVLPDATHMFGLSRDLATEELESISLMPGPHLAGGRMMLPVLRSHALLAARLAVLPGIVAVAWHSARSWSSPEHFHTHVMRWIEGGAFPGFGLAALVPTPDGGIATEGLSLFTGQDLVLGPELAEDRPAGARIALRLMHWLVENGPLAEGETLTGPSGEHLRLEPSQNRRSIKVWKT